MTFVSLFHEAALRRLGEAFGLCPAKTHPVLCGGVLRILPGPLLLYAPEIHDLAHVGPL